MRVGLYSEHLYQDGQIGTGASKYIYYLIRELERLGVDPLAVEDRFVVSRQPTPEPPFLVQVGVHRRIKEPMVTLAAFEQIADRIPHDLQFIGGDNRFLDPVRARLHSVPSLASRVRIQWPGEEAIPLVYNRASLVIHPCPEEGFGFVPLEALACGAHVVARAPAVRETLGPSGCYFDEPTPLGSRILECLDEGPKGTAEERSRHAKQVTC